MPRGRKPGTIYASGAGRPRKYIRLPIDPDRVWLAISRASALALQARMLRDEGAATPEALVEWLIRDGVLPSRLAQGNKETR